jgi:aspartate/methionine/tyrosine aminotransferase
LRKAFSSKTKMLVLNTPHNPTGKCFTREELETISEILKDFPDVVVLSDEVYDFLTFDGLEHIPFATIGDNWNRTVTVYSGGKLLNATGWKVGWSIAPERILRLGGIINNTTTYCTNNPA